MLESLPLKAVLWDLDGVIVDSFDGHFRAWARLFAELDEPFTLEDFTRTFGMNNRGIFKTLLKRELPEEEFRQLSDRKEEYFRDGILGRVVGLPGVRDWLQCFDGMGLKQAVGSSAPQENIDVLLKELGLSQWFSALVAGASIPGKPDPAVFLRAAELLGVQPAECLVIEDAVAGVEAAKRAGMRCLAVCTTNPAEKLQKADRVVADLTHLTMEMLTELAG